MTPELRKAIEEIGNKAQAYADKFTENDNQIFAVDILIAYEKGAEACFELMQVDRWAFENLTRKLNEANTRIVEFDGIKAGHLKVQAEMQAEIERLRDLIAKADSEMSEKGYCDMSQLFAALKDPGGV